MKKGVFACLFIFTGLTLGKTQVAYYDAIDLRRWIDTNSSTFKSDVNSLKDICGILKKYIVEFHDTTDIQTVIAAITTNDAANVFYNPLLADFFNIIVPEGASSSGKIKSKAGIAKIGGLDVTTIANGIAQFMIERAKQELTVAFFERFKKFANDNQEFQVLFPKTTDNLSNLLSHSYPEMLPALRTGFFEDIKSSPYHLDDVLELPRYHALLRNAPEVRVAIRSVRLIHELESGESHAADILTRFADFDEWKESGSHGFTNFGSSVKLAALFSQSLRRIDQVPEKKMDTIITKENLVHNDTIFNKVITVIRDINDIVTTSTVTSKEYFNTLLGITEVKSDKLIQVSSASDTRKKANISATATNSAWIDFNEMTLLVKDAIAFKLYLGLLYQEINRKSITFYSDKGEAILFTSILQDQKDNLFLFQNKVREFIELANKVDRTLDSIRSSDTILIANRTEAFADYIDVSLDVIDYALSVGKLFDERLDLDQYTLIARRANDLYRNIYKQEYTQAINSVIDILDEVRSMTSESRKMVISDTKSILEETPALNIKLDENKNGEDLSRKQVKKLDAYVSTLKSDSPHYEPLRKLKSVYNFNQLSGKLAKISRYGLFIANMAEADSPDEVASILENAVLPVGSSSIKKRSRFNLAIQSYLGAYARLGDIKYENTSAWTSDFGVSAPIGLAFSSGLCSKAGSLSAFVTLLDLGAVVDYQLKSDSISTGEGTMTTQMVKDYKIELGQIFSPGGYIVYGLPLNLPLALGIGGQYGPGLGKIGDNGDAVINNPQWRWNMFLSVDIPFFNIVNVHKDRRLNSVTKTTKKKKSK